MTFTQQKHQNGFSVVEVMIAMLLSMALAGGIISVFVNNSYSFKQDENIGRMQDNARFALREIAFDISMAGHYADLHIPDSVSYDGDLAIATPCGPAGQDNWIYRTTEAGNSLSIMAVDNATNAAASAAHSCFDGSEILDGTDVVAIKRVAGAETTPSANGAYLRTNWLSLLHLLTGLSAPAFTTFASLPIHPVTTSPHCAGKL
jgi:Tfp pilus assembly protein PilW